MSLLRSISNQQKYIDKLYVKLKLTSLDEWKRVSRTKFRFYSADKLLTLYSNDIPLLLTTLYPNFPWEFDEKKKKERLKTREEKLGFMEKLFVKLRLKEMEDWLKVTRNKIKVNGGEEMINEYNNSLPNLLSALYPSYPWPFHLLKPPSTLYFKSIDNQRQFMEEVYIKEEFTSLEGFLTLTVNKLRLHGGLALLSTCSSHGREKIDELLLSLFPFFPWPFLDFPSPLFPLSSPLFLSCQ